MKHRYDTVDFFNLSMGAIGVFGLESKKIYDFLDNVLGLDVSQRSFIVRKLCRVCIIIIIVIIIIIIIITIIIIIIIISLINQQYNTVTLASTLLTTIATKICQLLFTDTSYQ